MACNSLHFIDVLSFLTDNSELSLSTVNLSRQIHDAKRPGFKEVTGLLSGKLGESHFSIHCLKDLSPISITICSDSISLRIDESNGNYEIAEKSSEWKWKSHQERIVYFQSETTNLMVEDILLNGRCALPTYADAMTLHLPFIDAILKHLNESGAYQFRACPIT